MKREVDWESAELYLRRLCEDNGTTLSRVRAIPREPLHAAILGRAQQFLGGELSWSSRDIDLLFQHGAIAKNLVLKKTSKDRQGDNANA